MLKLDLRIASVLAVASSVLACSSSSSPAKGTTDGGGGDTGTPDGGKSDGTASDTGAPADSSSGDAGPTPLGTQLIATDSAELFGVTSDGYAIYAAAVGMTASLWAVSITGGADATPKKIIDFDSSLGGEISVQGTVVLVWPGVSTKGVGSMSSWTSTGGIHSLATLAYIGVGIVSTDNTTVIYSSNVPDSGLTGDLYVANVSGSGATLLKPSISLQGACTPIIGFSGSTIVASYCPSAAATDGGAADAGAADGGASPGVAILSNFAGASWAETDMLTDLPLQAVGVCGSGAGCALWSADKMGKQVVATTTAGELEAFPLPTGAPIMIDTVGGVTGSEVEFTDGSGVVYTTVPHGLKYSPLPAAAATTLVASTPTGISQLSSDNKWAMYYDSLDSTTGFSDLYLASTTKAGTPVTLSSAMTALTFGVDFTQDSSHALYYLDATMLPAPSGGSSPGLVGTLTAIPTAGGAAATLGMNVWANEAGAGSKVIYQNNFISTGGSYNVGVADVYSIDSAGGTATLVTPGADATGVGGPILNAAKTQIVYTFSQSGAAGGDGGVDAGDAGADLNGVYVVAAP